MGRESEIWDLLREFFKMRIYLQYEVYKTVASKETLKII